MAEPIRLEPKSAFDRAIIKISSNGVATYSYWILVECAEELHNIDSTPDAMDWVDFNIVGLMGNPNKTFEVDYGDINDNE
jgi:hypothetical protein